ncbi:MAG TPA: hypothetical protein VKB38_03410 [Terracidiphilus sp.]|nr:hypothetical protein [Terracidiphilus sp.]
MRRLVGFAALTLAAACAQAQWQVQTSNTTADLRGIDNVGKGVAWASGTNGTVLRTEDGGYVWQTCAVPPGAEKLDFRGVQAFDANTAIVMSSGKGDLSRLYKTMDGCHTWKLIFKNPDKDGFWDAVNIDSRGQWITVLGDPVHGRFVLFESSDKGRHWNWETSKGMRAKASEQGAFAASNSSFISLGAYGFATGGSGGAFMFLQTSVGICLDDCGPYDTPPDKWERFSVPIGDSTESSGVFSLASSATLPEAATGVPSLPGVLMAVGGDYLKPNEALRIAAFSTDKGKTWSAAESQPHGYRSSVAYDAATKTWITVGPNGTDISTDDGRNWRAVHPSAALHEASDADRNWNALSLPFVVGPKGRIGKLDEGALKQAPESGGVK